MRRSSFVLLCAIALGACAGDAEPPAQPATAELQVGFPSGGLADTIAVTAVERLPLHAAELVAPDGATTQASSIDVNAAPSVRTGQWVAGNPWETALTGTSATAALTAPDEQVNAALHSQVQLLAMVSQADIPLPDPVAYRRDWANYRVRLTFGTPPGELETREIPAPEPPPIPAAPPPTPVPPPG